MLKHSWDAYKDYLWGILNEMSKKYAFIVARVAQKRTEFFGANNALNVCHAVANL